jgi:hypothetical protein
MLQWLQRLIGRRTSVRDKSEMRLRKFMVKPAARQFIEHNYPWRRCDIMEALDEFSFGDGREDEYPLDELRRLALRRTPKLSDERGDD